MINKNFNRLNTLFKYEWKIQQKLMQQKYQKFFEKVSRILSWVIAGLSIMFLYFDNIYLFLSLVLVFLGYIVILFFLMQHLLQLEDFLRMEF